MKKRMLFAAAVSMVMMSTSAFATQIGVSMDKFDDNFLTVLRNSMQDYAKTKNVSLTVEDAQDDIGKQLNQIQNFIASHVDAIIVNPVDTDATTKMTALADAAHIPLVYVNRMPVNLDKLPANEAFVGSDESKSGTLEMTQVCKLMNGKGNILVMMGELSNQAARQRTQDVVDVIGKAPCTGIKILDKQTANWDRTKAADLMTNWISAGLKFDAVVSNNDEMAIGAIQSLKAAGIDTKKKVIVSGIDATADGLAAMKAGDLKVTVFQNAAGQGKGAIDTAMTLAKGGKVDRTVWVPFELVTPETMAKYMAKN